MVAEGSDAAEMEDYETDAEVTWKRMERKSSLENNSIKLVDFYFHPSGPEFLHSTQHSELQVQHSHDQSIVKKLQTNCGFQFFLFNKCYIGLWFVMHNNL